VTMDLLSKFPSIEEKLGSLVEVNESFVRPKLLRSLTPHWLQKRATMGQWLEQKTFEPEGPLGGMSFGPGYAYNAREPGKMDTMSMTDPNTGQLYKTTRGAAMSAEGQDHKATLGAMALLAPLYYAALGRAKIPHGFLRGGLAAGGAALTAKPVSRFFSPYRNPTYMTDQGMPVSGGTEFAKSSALPDGAIGTIGLLHKAAYDYYERTKDPLNPREALEKRYPASHSHAIKVAWISEGAERLPYDPTDPVDVDLLVLFNKLGSLILT